MPIVGVFPSNSFSLVPLPWKIPLEEQHPADKCSKSLELCTSGRRYTVLSSHFRPCDVLPESCFQLLSYPRAYVCKTYNKRQIPLSCVQRDGTLLNVTCWVRLHTLLHFVGCCCVLLRKVWNLSTFSTLQTGATLLANEPDVVESYICVRLHTLLHFVGCCCLFSRKVWNLSNF